MESGTPTPGELATDTTRTVMIIVFSGKLPPYTNRIMETGNEYFNFESGENPFLVFFFLSVRRQLWV